MSNDVLRDRILKIIERKGSARTSEISNELFGESDSPHHNRAYRLVISLRRDRKIIGVKNPDGSPWRLL